MLRTYFIETTTHRNSFRSPGSHAPDFFGSTKKFETFQKNPKKIMHVPDHGEHRRDKCRTEMTPYASWTKMTKS